jgi:hypothetical protein
MKGRLFQLVYRNFWLDLAFGHCHQEAFCGLKNGALRETFTWAIPLIPFCGFGFMAYRRRNQSA